MSTAAAKGVRTVRDLVWQEPDLMSWWIRFQVSAPELTTRLGEVRLLQDEASARAELAAHVLQVRGEYGAGWCSFDGTPAVRDLVFAAVGAAYDLEPTLARYLAAYLERVGELRSVDLGVFAHAVAEACGSWAVEDVERRLEMPLGRAYCRAGSMPLWATGAGRWTVPEDPETGEYRPDDPEAFRRREPAEFFLACLEGVYYGDSFWTQYTKLLFGPIPPDAPMLP